MDYDVPILDDDDMSDEERLRHVEALAVVLTQICDATLKKLRVALTISVVTLACVALMLMAGAIVLTFELH